MASESERNLEDDMSPLQKRQKLTGPSLATDPGSLSCGILDALPSKIRERIAQHACSGKETFYFGGPPSAIALGLTSKTQCRTVSDIFSGILVVNNFSSVEDVARWITFTNQILELDLIDKPSPEVLLKVLSHATVPLRKLSLCELGLEQLSNVLQLVPELRELEVAIGNEGNRFNFVKAVSNKQLRKLKIRRGSCTEISPRCVIETMGFPSADCFANDISAVCGNLEELSLRCDCYEEYCHVTTFDATKVPHLRSLSLHTQSRFPDSVVSSLRSVESLSISGTNAVQITGLVGSNVSAISTVGEFDTSPLQSLLRCPRLRKLDLAIESSFASELATVVAELRSLREFTVTSSETYGTMTTIVIEFAPGAVLGIVKALPALEKLHLLYTRISQDEIVDVLEELGKRLISFEGLGQWQAEGWLERIEALLCAAIRFNPRLEHFDVRALCSNVKSRFHSSEILRVKLLMKKLQTVAPLVDMGVLSNHLNTY